MTHARSITWGERERERRFLVWLPGHTTPEVETVDREHANYVMSILEDNGLRPWMQNLSANQETRYQRRYALSGCTGCRSHGHPPHDPSPMCKSGKRAHCTCDTCF